MENPVIAFDHAGSTATVPQVEPVQALSVPVQAPIQSPVVIAPPPINWGGATVYADKVECVNFEEGSPDSVFEVSFKVNFSDPACPEKWLTGTIVKRIRVCKESLVKELIERGCTTAFVEDKQVEQEPEAVAVTEAVNDTAKRMRELAGIPHNKNHV